MPIAFGVTRTVRYAWLVSLAGTHIKSRAQRVSPTRIMHILVHMQYHTDMRGAKGFFFFKHYISIWSAAYILPRHDRQKKKTRTAITLFLSCVPPPSHRVIVVVQNRVPTCYVLCMPNVCEFFGRYVRDFCCISHNRFTSASEQKQFFSQWRFYEYRTTCILFTN